jgi:ornithine cyclodeaminase
MLIARKIKRVRVWSRTLENAKAFAAREGERFNISIEAMPSAEEAVAGADIICTTTSSQTPVLSADWIRPGAHINAVGSFGSKSREIDTTTVVRSRFFVDRRESAHNEAGEYLIPLKEGSVREDHIQGELAEVLAGKVPGRTSPDEITLFKSLGLAMEDLASAHYCYEKAMEKGVGVSVELGGERHGS